MENAVPNRKSFFVGIIVLIISCFVYYTPAETAIIHVPVDASSIQGGIDLATDGDTILVTAGTYSGPGNEAIRFNGKKILLKAESDASMTVLLTTDTVRTIIFDQGEDSSAILDGFTISGGYESIFDWSNPFRGGILINGASPLIRNCVITGCYALDGGGIYIGWSSTNIVDCVIDGNRANHWGAGLFIINGSVIVQGSTIIHNQAWDGVAFMSNSSGGGVANILGELRLSGCDISGNLVSHTNETVVHSAGGGGIFNLWGAMQVEDCRIANNYGIQGGAILSPVGGQILISHCLVFNNVAISRAGIVLGVKNPLIDGLLASHCTFTCNYAAESYGDGIALTNETESPVLERYLMEVGRPKRSPDDLGIAGTYAVKDNILAFNSSAAITQSRNDISMEILNNDVWYTVSGPDYGGLLNEQTGMNGNFSADPLFCSVSDSGFTIDVSSPCVGAASDGGDIGAFGTGCDLYQGGTPKMVTATLVADAPSLANQDSLEAAFTQTNPWDTLYINYPGTHVRIKPIVIDYPLYVIGNGLDNSLTLLSETEDSLGNVRCMELKSFCIIDRFRMEAMDMSPYSTDTTAAIGCRAGSPIVRNCELIASGWHDDLLDLPVATTGSSPLIRNCAFNSIISRMGNFGARDVIASGNYWFDTAWAEIETRILDGRSIPGAGYAYYQPYLTTLPTSVETEAPDPRFIEIPPLQNYPNPFNGGTTISFHLSSLNHVRLEIFDILGRKITTVLDETCFPGARYIVWSGQDSHGTIMPSGVYFCRLSTIGYVQTRKLLVLK